MKSRDDFFFQRVSHRISSVWSSLANNWRMDAPCRTTTSKRSPPFTSSFVFVEVCRSLWRLSLERRSPSKWSLQTPSRMSRPRFRTKVICIDPYPSSLILIMKFHHDLLFVCSRGYPIGSAAFDFCWQAVGGWAHSVGLQYWKGVQPSSRPSSSWWDADLCENVDWEGRLHGNRGHSRNAASEGTHTKVTNRSWPASYML